LSQTRPNSNQIVFEDGASALDPATLGQLQAGEPFYYIATGTNAMTATPAPALTAYVAGQGIVLSVIANTGAATLDLNSLGVKNVKLPNGNALAGGELVGTHTFMYDGTNFIVTDSVGGTDVKTSGELTFNDNAKISLGTSGAESDIYSNGTDTLLDMLSGNVKFRDTTTDRFTFARTTGDFTATGNLSGLSDISLKANILPISGALNKTNAIGGVTFDRIDIDVPRQAGVIAQAVEAQLPEAVFIDEDGIRSVSVLGMIGLLVAAINELTERLERVEGS